MVKSQSIVDLWVRWGELVDQIGECSMADISVEMDIVIARLHTLCRSYHGAGVGEVIRAYRESGWVD